MRMHGTLVTWHDERGFGFILPAQGTEEIFVHISAFPRGATRPLVGETVAFEIETTADGRKRAVRARRPIDQPPAAPRGHRPARRPARARPARSRASAASAAAGLLAVVAIAAFGFNLWRGRSAAPAPAAAVSTVASPATALSDPEGRCDGRTRCPQMRSCEEATYFLRHCPRTQMDGDHDGIPCEQQWCG